MKRPDGAVGVVKVNLVVKFAQLDLRPAVSEFPGPALTGQIPARIRRVNESLGHLEASWERSPVRKTGARAWYEIGTTQLPNASVSVHS